MGSDFALLSFFSETSTQIKCSRIYLLTDFLWAKSRHESKNLFNFLQIHFFRLEMRILFFSRHFLSTIKKKVHKRGTENVSECLATRDLHVIISLHNATCIETR